MAITGQLEMGLINTQPQRLFAFSWAFWVLLITSAYTANLANFFVTKSASSFQVETIAQAVELGMSICVRNGTGTHIDILENFSKERAPRPRLVLSDSVEEIFQRLNDGECDIVATELSLWKVERLKKEVDADCDLFWNGIVQLAMNGGIAMSVDSVCSLIIFQTVDLHLREMVQDGAIIAIWEKYASLFLLRDCSA
jgi:hypothetical protein